MKDKIHSAAESLMSYEEFMRRYPKVLAVVNYEGFVFVERISEEENKAAYSYTRDFNVREVLFLHVKERVFEAYIRKDGSRECFSFNVEEGEEFGDGLNPAKYLEVIPYDKMKPGVSMYLEEKLAQYIAENVIEEELR